MEKSFSQLELLQTEMGKLKANSIIDRAFYFLTKTKYVNLTIKLKGEYLIRAMVICEDITESGELEKPFKVTELVGILLDDFLRVIRDEENYESLYDRLKVRNKTNKESHIINQSLAGFDAAEKITEDSIDLKFSLRRKSLLRGEIVLSELAKQYPNHNFTVETIIELIFIDFIKAYHGLRADRGKIIKNILLRM